jgi:hypothetical protein
MPVFCYAFVHTVNRYSNGLLLQTSMFRHANKVVTNGLYRIQFYSKTATTIDEQILTPIELYRCGLQGSYQNGSTTRKLIVPITKYWIQRYLYNDNLKLPKFFIHVSLRKQCTSSKVNKFTGCSFAWKNR